MFHPTDKTNPAQVDGGIDACTDGYRQYLTADGEIKQPLPLWSHNNTLLLDCYKTMVLTRLFDAKCVALQRTGQLGTYPSCLGQEAIGTAIGKAMHSEDVFVPYYRDQATQISRGVRLKEILLYWGGDERGSDFAGPRQDLPNCIPIATQCCHAAGLASAFKIRHQKRVAVCTLGDGASSKGDFLESLNLAGIWQLPAVFVINNNQWAISVPRHLQCGATRLADKALGAGVDSISVDGNDLLAVYEAVKQACDKARSGKGATLIEALSYRLSDHTTADDADRYRSREELNQAWQREPIKRLQNYLHSVAQWDEQHEQALIDNCQHLIDQAVDDYLSTPPLPPESMFEHLYAELPVPLLEQYTAVKGKKPS